jgi:hypothetical protein
LEELTDHLEDLKEEGMDQNSSSRLGKPEQVAEAAAVAYRRRSFLGRHPAAAFLVFAISPVVSFIVLFVAGCLLTGLILFGVGMREMPNGIAGCALCLANSLPTVVIPSILAIILYCQLARRLGLGTTWILVSSVAIALIASSIGVWPGPVDHYQTLGLCWSGLWHGGWGGWVAKIQFLVQLIVPLTFAWWFMRRKPGPGRLELAS